MANNHINSKKIYILAAEQISVQQPLSEEWTNAPILYDNQKYVRAIDPDYKQFFAPNTARRLGKILKRAMLTSRRVMETTGISLPDAIITGTGFGCVENTEIFLEALVKQGEEFLKPTHFMQSTHNTISSLIAVENKCHGYNSTYTQKGTSFDCALLDAFMQLQSGQIKTALVGAHDEITPNFHVLLERIGHADNSFCAEASVSMMLADDASNDYLCVVAGIENAYNPNDNDILDIINRLLQEADCTMEDIDAVMINSSPESYEKCARLMPEKKLIGYNHIFGNSFSVSGLGIYAAATCLKQQKIPKHLFINDNQNETKDIKHILVYNQYENKNHTFVLLSCGN